MFSITRDTSGTIFCTGSQALPGNPDSEALPPIFVVEERGRASGHRFPGRAGEPVKRAFFLLPSAITQDYVDSLKLLFDCQHF